MGGPPPEHEVSLNTGKEVCANLNTEKYLVSPLVIPKNGKWNLPRVKPDVAFIAMHGAYGEDGTIQGLLETAKIPYTGSGVLASALGMNKPRSCAIFREAGLNVPEFKVIMTERLNLHNRDYRGPTSIGWPKVVKPANHGSSIGVHIVKNRKELHAGIHDAFRYSDRVMIQEFIKGREITCGVLEKNNKLLPLPPMEILPKKGNFYDYKSKYDEGGSKHLIPPPGLSQKTIRAVQDAACRAHNVLGCYGMSRSDFILGDDGKLYILEINTIPGMTATSLLPEAAKAAGIDFFQLTDMLIVNALSKKRGGEA